MNKYIQWLPSFAFCLALSIIALQAWQKGIVQVQTNSIYQCTFNGLQHLAKGTRIKVTLSGTRIVWTHCGENKILDV